MLREIKLLKEESSSDEEDSQPWVKPIVPILPQQIKAAFSKTCLGHNSELHYKSTPNVQKLTGIMCTIGNASRNIDTLIQMFEAGMNIARLNLSHSSLDQHLQTIDMLQRAVRIYSQKTGYLYPLGIAMDTRGPELRIGGMKGNKEIDLKEGQTFVLSVNPEHSKCGNDKFIYVDDPNLPKVVKPGDTIYMNRGMIKLVVTDTTEKEIITTVQTAGKVRGEQSLTIPGVPIIMPAITEQDRKDLKFAAHLNVDFILGSHIRDADMINEMRQVMGPQGRGCMIIPKIENSMSVDYVDELIVAADGIMIPRSDLSMDLPSDKTFLAQKMIFTKCNMMGKPCICASEMLDSMTDNLKPTCAEVADVANAVLDGCDCVTLSNETAKGKNPVLAVKTMSDILKEAESVVWVKQFFAEMCKRVEPPIEPVHVIAIEAVNIALLCCAAAILVVSSSGRTARLVARYRPRCPVIDVTRHSKVVRHNTVFRGVISVHYPAPPEQDWLKDVELRIKRGVMYGKKEGFIGHQDPIILLTGWRQGSGYTNTLRIVYASASNTPEAEIIA